MDVLKAIMCCLRGPGESRFQVLRPWAAGTSCCLPSPCSSAPSASCSAGLVLAENVFSYRAWGPRQPPRGMGRTSLLLGYITLFSAVFVFVGNLLANIICSIADPQIRGGFDHET